MINAMQSRIIKIFNTGMTSLVSHPPCIPLYLLSFFPASLTFSDYSNFLDIELTNKVLVYKL